MVATPEAKRVVVTAAAVTVVVATVAERAVERVGGTEAVVKVVERVAERVVARAAVARAAVARAAAARAVGMGERFHTYNSSTCHCTVHPHR